MKYAHRRCDCDLTALDRRLVFACRANFPLAAASLLLACIVAAATPAAAATTANPNLPGAATAAASVPAPAAAKAKGPSRPQAGGAKLRVSPYVRFRLQREAADRANASGKQTAADRPAGQAPPRRLPK
jgi:hypothetical protein